MSDLSLQDVPHRLAIQGEVLITYRFRTGSIGLASPLEIAAANILRPQAARRQSLWSAWKRLLKFFLQPDPTPAVHVSGGARLRVNLVPGDLSEEFGVSSVEDVTFIRFSSDGPSDRQAIRFRNGRHVLLQRFGEGVPFQVLTDGSNDEQLDRAPERPCKLSEPEFEVCPGASR
jgi:hypothetical protein